MDPWQVPSAVTELRLPKAIPALANDGGRFRLAFRGARMGAREGDDRNEMLLPAHRVNFFGGGFAKGLAVFQSDHCCLLWVIPRRRGMAED